MRAAKWLFRDDVVSLRTFLSLADFHRDLLPLFQRLEPFHLDGRVMNEHILAAFALICGFFIDTLPALIILTPVLGPIAYSAGVDPLQFGMMLVLNLTVGMITPPVGPVLFVISTVGRLRVEHLSKAVLPLLAAELCVLLLVILVPGISTFVPRYFGFAN